MELFDDCAKAAAGHVEEVEAFLERLGFFGFISLMDGIVPHFPGLISGASNRGPKPSPTTTLNATGLVVVNSASYYKLLPLYNRPQLLNMDEIVQVV